MTFTIKLKSVSYSIDLEKDLATITYGGSKVKYITKIRRIPHESHCNFSGRVLRSILRGYV